MAQGNARTTALWDAFSEITGDYSESGRARLFHDNAVRIYRLD